MANHGDVILLSNQLESQTFEGFDDFCYGGIYGKLRHLHEHACFGNKGFKDRGIVFKNIIPKSFDVKCDGGFDI